MRYPTRVAKLATLTALAVTAACSTETATESSTAPSTETPFFWVVGPLTGPVTGDVRVCVFGDPLDPANRPADGTPVDFTWSQGGGDNAFTLNVGDCTGGLGVNSAGGDVTVTEVDPQITTNRIIKFVGTTPVGSYNDPGQTFSGNSITTAVGAGVALWFKVVNCAYDCETPPPPPPPPGDEGCTPGYWKQSQHFGSWTTYTPTTSFETVVGRNAYSGTPTFLTVLNFSGGGLQALGRHTAAALLNAASSGVAYPYSEAQIIAAFQAAFDSGDATIIEGVKNELDAANNGADGCPLD